VDITVEDLASVLVRFDNGAKGTFSVGQVCPGHKNDLVLEICGARSSVKWRQEHQNELSFGHRDRPNEILQKDPSLIVEQAKPYAHLPGGHQEARADAFCNLMRDIYGAIAAGTPYRSLPPTVATRRRSVPHSLRSVPRDPDGPGHEVDFSVPEGSVMRRIP
jgi:predicted dehydrogenase